MKIYNMKGEVLRDVDIQDLDRSHVLNLLQLPTKVNSDNYYQIKDRKKGYQDEYLTASDFLALKRYKQSLRT